MGITLATLKSRLQADVPAVDSVPSSDQYERAVIDAVADFSRRCGTEKIAALAVVSGTASYTLEDDFLKLIAIETPFSPDGVLINSDSQLVPLPKDFQEQYTVRGTTITFYPTPTYSMSKDYRYKAGWALNSEGDEYEDMGEEEAGIVLLKAQATCLTKQSNAMSTSAMDYQQGDVKVSTGPQMLAMRAQLEAVERQYLDACEKYNGQYGVLA